MTPQLLAAAVASPVPFLPGAATVSEMLALEERGFTALKFDLMIDGKASPELIFIGAKGEHPKEAVFALPAKPAKK